MSTKLPTLLVGQLGPAAIGLNLRPAGQITLILIWFLLDFSFLANDLAFMYFWKTVETTGSKIEVTEIAYLCLGETANVSTC